MARPPSTQTLSEARWTVRAAGDLSDVPMIVRNQAVPATIPGCVHTDLMDAGLIPDPAIGDHEKDVQWVGRTDWRYETSFEAAPALLEHDQIDLVFECLDTIATIELNGAKIGEAASEFMPHRFGVHGMVRPGENRLVVTFRSPIRHVLAEAARLGPRPVNGDWDPFVFARKCASNFQWDWGPRVATCGVSGDVRLEAWSTARLGRVRCEIFHQLASLSIAVAAPVRTSIPRDLVVELTVTDALGRVVEIERRPIDTGKPDTDLSFGISLDRWWPHGHGAQALYAANVRLLLGDVELDRWERRVGLRHSGLNYWGEQEVGQFVVHINETPMFLKGVNWIPEGLWPRDRTPERVRRRLQQLIDANMNTIRVWGGGRYEPDWFYDLCDEMGILVWQDFMFACAMYPEENPYPALIEAEARYQVARLSSHPSVILWCGGNECIWGHEAWGWKEKLRPGQTWGRRYWLDLLPRVVSELDPTRPYWPNSPWSGDEKTAPNDAARGDRHTWEVWGEGYRSVVPRFCSEMGQQSPSTYATLSRAGLTKEKAEDKKPQMTQIDTDRAAKNERGGFETAHHGSIHSLSVPSVPSVSSAATPSSPLGPVEPSSTEPASSSSLLPALLSARQRGPGGNERWYDEPIRAWFRAPRDFDEWHYLAQLLQARCMSIGLEWLRVNRPRCMGALVWQHNDAWPGLTWSLVDSDGRPKPAWHAVRAAFAPVLLSMHPPGGNGAEGGEGRANPALFIDNDSPGALDGEIALRRVSFDGGVSGAARVRVRVAPFAGVRCADPVGLVGPTFDPARELLVAEGFGTRALWFHGPDRTLAYPEARFDTRLETDGQRHQLHLTARTLLRDIVIAVDRLDPDATIDPQLVTLLPGDAATFTIDSARPLAIEELTTAPVFRCVNGFGGREGVVVA